MQQKDNNISHNSVFKLQNHTEFCKGCPNEEKVVFNVPKCSHCVGTIEDEWEIEPLYQPDSYI
jgi:hypothetical protein